MRYYTALLSARVLFCLFFFSILRIEEDWNGVYRHSNKFPIERLRRFIILFVCYFRPRSDDKRIDT